MVNLVWIPILVMFFAVLAVSSGYWFYRFRAERALKEGLLRASGLEMCVREPDGKLSKCTSGFRALLEDKDTPWLEAFPVEEREELSLALEKLADERGEKELSVLNGEGRQKWIKLCFMSLNDSGRSVLTVEDISERKHLEIQNQESEQRFAQMFYLFPMVAAITQVATGRFVDVNHMWEPLYGYSREETIGRTSLELNVWANLEDRKTLISSVLRDGSIRDFVFRSRHRSGRIFDCRGSARLIDQHGERFLLFITQDVSEELRVARELRESESKFSTIFRASVAPLLLSKMEDGLILDANQAWVDFIGFSLPELIGSSSNDLGIWADPVDRQRIIEELKEHGFVGRAEGRLRTKSGVIRLCLISCRCFELNGESSLIWSLHDVTEQREMERTIQEMNATLELRVRDRTHELEKANSELNEVLETLQRAQDELVRSEKLAALGGLVAGVAHELNTPIGNSLTAASALQWRTHQLRQELAEGTLKKSALNDFLEYVETGSSLLMHGLEQARDLVSSFKQVAVDRSSDLRRRFDLLGVVQEILRTHHAVLSHNPCPVTVELEIKEGIELDSFPGSLGQVLGNFISNALLHAFEGRVSGKLRISGKREGDMAVLVFEDDGIGVPIENQKRIFDPFFTTKFGQGGSGLGLHIVYNIVTNVLGGRIQVESGPDHGTRFRLWIPLSAPQTRSANPFSLDSGLS